MARGLSLQKIRAIQENKRRATHSLHAIEALEMRLKHHDWHTIAGRSVPVRGSKARRIGQRLVRIAATKRCGQCLKKLEKDLKEYPEIKAILDKHRK